MAASTVLPETTPPAAAPASAYSPCPACGRPLEPAPGARRVETRRLRCPSCGLSRLAALPDRAQSESSYQEDYYEAGTGARFLGAFEALLGLFRWLRVRSILRRRSGPGRILDVGCGRGDLLEAFQRRGWIALGTQVSRTAARAARERRGVEVLVGELPELCLEAESFDVITLFHVVEHLRDPGAYVREALRLLRPGGLLLIEAPDSAGVGFQLLGERHFCFDHPHHLFFFGRRSLAALIESCGARVEGVSRFSLEYSPYTCLQSLLNAAPGRPNRLYGSFQRNPEGRSLRRSPWTWAHAAAAAALALPALCLSLALAAVGQGNTLRVYARKPA